MIEPIAKKPDETWQEMNDRHNSERRSRLSELADEGLTQSQAAKALCITKSYLNNLVHQNKINWPVLRPRPAVRGREVHPIESGAKLAKTIYGLMQDRRPRTRGDIFVRLPDTPEDTILNQLNWLARNGHLKVSGEGETKIWEMPDHEETAQD
jgi:hypothetical protein